MTDSTIPLATLKDVARLIHAAEGSKGIHPGLQRVRVTIDPECNLSAMATNRYLLARYETLEPVSSFASDVQFYIDANLAKWILALKTPKRGPQSVVAILNDDATQLTLTHDGVSYVADVSYTGNYPPIEKLINDWRPADTGVTHRFNPARMTEILKVLNGLSFSMAYGHPGEFSKNAPARITALSPDGAYLALVQPEIGS